MSKWTSTKNGFEGWTKCVTVGGTMLKNNVLGFLKLTPSTLGHELINQPFYL